MKVGSMFAGIGGFDLGFERAGFEVAWCIEWDRHAQAVLRKRFPNAKVFGDIREVDPSMLERVDVICGGFPCQDLSVAGKRAGLAGERSGLFHDAMRLVRKLRPRVLILENVPGLLSSNRGLDFATVLREVGEGWDCEEVAWRVLDSRFFGVPQRRRRVFVVAGSRAGCAESILALGESSGGNPAEERAARKEAPGDAASGFGADGAKWWDGSDIAASMTTRCHDQFMPDKGNFAAIIEPRSHWDSETAPHPTLLQSAKATGSPGYSDQEIFSQRGSGLVPFRKSKRAQTDTDDETWVADGAANTLNGFDTGDTRTTHAVAICFGISNQPTPKFADNLSPPLDAKCSGGGRVEAVATPMTVRRLTPTECERLQGFPDGWTQIGETKPTADSHRYKQLGNAVTVNVAEWIARRAMQFLCSSADARPEEGRSYEGNP